MVTQKQATRRLLIKIAKRHQRPGTGSSVAFLRERTASIKVPDLTRVLAGIPWAVVGAIATRSYMPERVTQDLDIAIRPQDASEVVKRLQTAGFIPQGILSIGGSSWLAPDGFTVDVIELRRPWAVAALEKAQENLKPPGFPVLPLPYLVLMKFEAGRVVDLGDAARMLGQASANELEEVRSLFRRHAADDLEDLEGLITLGQLEFQSEQENK